MNLIYEIDNHGHRTQRYSYPSEEEEKVLTKRGIIVECCPMKLDIDEEVALKQIDLMKNEMLSIYRFKQSTGRDRFDLAPAKANSMHDDKAYVLGLLSYQLMLLRRESIINKKRNVPTDISSLFTLTKAKPIDKLFS